MPGRGHGALPGAPLGDLWSRAMLLTVPGAAAVPLVGTATGLLLPLGIDLQEHATAVQAQVHAVFEPADGTGTRLVRAAVSEPKPATVVGAGLWQLLRPHMSLLAAVSEGRSMDLTGMPFTAAARCRPPSVTTPLDAVGPARRRAGPTAFCKDAYRLVRTTSAVTASRPRVRTVCSAVR